MKTIAVVDDALDILEAIQMILEDAGYIVTVSQKGDFAESLVHAKKLPALLILDVLLSGKDGRDICRTLKSNPATKNMPILMLSAHPTVQQSVREVGADAFLPKPFDLDRFLHTVKDFV